MNYASALRNGKGHTNSLEAKCLRVAKLKSLSANKSSPKRPRDTLVEKLTEFEEAKEEKSNFSAEFRSKVSEWSN